MSGPTDGFQRIRYVSRAVLGLCLTAMITAAGLYFGIEWLPL